MALTGPRTARRARPSALQALVAAICLPGAATLVAVIALTEPGALTEPRWPLFLVLGALVLVGELLPIVLPRDDEQDEITVSTTFALALVLMGPLALALVVQSLAVVAEDVRDRKDPAKVVFNAAQYVLSLVAARAVFCALTGQGLLYGEPLQVPGDVPAALVAGLVFFVVNNTLVGVVTALARRAPVLRQITADVRVQLETSGVLVAFAPVAALALESSLWLTPLVLLPIAAIYRSARMAVERDRQSLHDTLTGLPNRLLFRYRINRAIESAERGDHTFAVVLVDLDHFKEINDTLGHQVGDDLLRLVAERIATRVRPGDTVARLGGDEFAILTDGLRSGQEGVVLAERLLEALEAPFTADGVQLDVQASLGVAVYGDHGVDVDSLLRRADIAMYTAKEHRGTVCLYEAGADEHDPERLALAAELRHGLQSGEIFAVYQPKIAAGDGSVVGLEALVRWRHPRHGVLLPDEFLPVVENTGLISPLTMTVLEHALDALAGWRAAGHDVSVAINLSVRHLSDLGLPAKIEDALVRHGIPPRALTLEVTETVLMSDPGRAVAVLGRLRQLGVSVAIDDFGTGYSSLAYLRRLQVDELKIDKSFVLAMSSDEGSAVIVRSTIEMGHNLGLRIVAEGVEQTSDLRVLHELHCDVLQGYALCRPLPADQVVDWLAQRPAARVPRDVPPWAAAAVAPALTPAPRSGLPEPSCWS